MTAPLPAIIRRIPKPWAAILFLLVLAAALLLFAGRRVEGLRAGWLLALDPDAYGYISNFSIACVLCAAIGYAWMMLGVRARTVAWLCVAIAAVNLVYETWIPLLNTRDPMDAAYGLAGVALAALLLAVIGRYGMVDAPATAS